MIGALTALQFERLVAVGQHMMVPAGQQALVQAAVTAGMAGFLCWAACALVVRGVRRVVLRPYEDLTDRLERIVDGDVEARIEGHGADVAVRRLARAVLAFQDRGLASSRAEMALQARYNALVQERADERRLLMSLLTRGASPLPADSPLPAPAPVLARTLAHSPAAIDLEIPAWAGRRLVTENRTIDLMGQFGSLAGRRTAPRQTALSL